MNKPTRLLAAALIPLLVCALLFGCNRNNPEPPTEPTTEFTFEVWTTEETTTEEETTEEETTEEETTTTTTRRTTTTTRKPTTTTKKPTTTTKATTPNKNTTIPDATKVTTTAGPTTTKPPTTAGPTTTVPPTTVRVTGVAFTGASSYPLNAGATQQLTWTVSPANATNKNVSFSSTKASVATVSDTGVVTAVGEGECEILIKTSDGNFQDSKPISVSVVPVTTINISSGGGVSTVTQGGTLQLNATALPANATNKTINWSVDAASDVATVSSSGLLSAKVKDNVERTVRVTATAADGKGATRYVDITIKTPG